MNPLTIAPLTLPEQVNPTGHKLLIVGRRKPGTTLAEHRHHIRQVHGELVLRYVAEDPENAPRRYAQNAVFDGSFRATSPSQDPFALNRDFVTEIWFPDIPTLQRSMQSSFYLQQLKGDEDNFVDQANVVPMTVRERETMRRGAMPASAYKLFGFLQCAPGADTTQFKCVWSQLAEALAAHPAGAAIRRHVQNDVIPRPGAAAPLDGIDEFWLDDEAAVRGLLAPYQAWVQEALVRPGLVAQTGHFALVASEALLYAGAR